MYEVYMDGDRVYESMSLLQKTTPSSSIYY